MRFLVLLFGLLGCFLTAVFSGMIIFQSQAKTELHNLIGDNAKHAEALFDLVQKDHIQTGLFLLLGAGIGFLGTVLAFFRCGWQGALLLLVPVIGPLILDWHTIAGTGVQALASVMCLFVGPLPINPKTDEDDDEDDDD